MSQQHESSLVKRNFTLGVINGSFWLLARALVDQDIILPAFAVALMGDNPLYVGLLVSLVSAGWFWPPLVMTPVMATRQRRHRYYKISAVIRLIAIVGAGLVAKLLAGDSPAVAFVAIALCYLVFTSGGGIGLIPFLSVITDSVASERRARFFAMRFFFGGLMAFAAGFWVKWLLSERSGLGFPDNYAYLFGVAALVTGISLSAFWFAHEPRHKVERRRLPFVVQLRRGLRRIRREPSFRRFIGARVLMAASYGLAVPFLVPYAYRSMGMTEAMVGIALAARVLCYSMLNLLWSRVSARYGNRHLMIVCGWLHAGALALALTTPLLPDITVGEAVGLRFTLPLAVLMGVFGLFGASRSGWITGQNAYLLDFTPERTRPVYLATYYLAAMPMAFMPLVAGLMIGTGGRYLLAFGISAGAVLLEIALTYRMIRLRGEDVEAAGPAS
ncbi:MAG: MFS transporter [Armatimonadota bacterium]|nr:MFS transporter [Armatimonadota bacterium]